MSSPEALRSVLEPELKARGYDVEKIDWAALIAKLLPLILAIIEALFKPQPTPPVPPNPTT